MLLVSRQLIITAVFMYIYVGAQAPMISSAGETNRDLAGSQFLGAGSFPETACHTIS
jgi:hypothetical protein